MAQEKLKICFIAPKAYQIFNPVVKTTFGGAEVQLYLLAKELASDNSLEVNFIVADYGQPELEVYAGVKVWRSLNFKTNRLRQILAFFSVFRRVGAQIYIQRTLTVFSGPMAGYCRLRKKKLVYMVSHDSETDNSHKVYKKVITRFLANLTFRLATVVVVQNQYQQQQLKINKKRDSLLLQSSYEIKDEVQPRGEYILWVARSMPWKRPELFLKLAQNFPQEKFVMICPPATDNPQLSEQIEKEALAISNLKFVKFVPFAEIDNYFAGAKIFVNTSVYEGFPNTFIQAAKNKIPILSLQVNPNDFITRYQCGCFCQDSFDLLNQRLQELLANPGLYQSMSAKAYQYAKENHDLKLNAKIFREEILTL
jgi:glycosyltransferase involved in cell wall biosynthesis